MRACVAAILVTGLTACGAARGAGGPPAAQDGGGGRPQWLAESPRDEPAPPAIQWGASWPETWKVNAAAWQKQVESATREYELRQRRINARLAYLAEAMIERFRPTGAERLAALQQAAKHLETVDRRRSHAYRLRIVEEFPGELAGVAEALHGIIDAASPVEDGQWIEYAAERLLALHGAGVLGDAHEWVADALTVRLEARKAAGRLAEARADLEALRRHVPPEEGWWEQELAELLFLAGRAEQARKVLEALPPPPKPAAGRRGRRERAARDLEESTEPSLPRRLELEARWDFLVSHPSGLQAELADDLLAGLAASPAMIAGGERIHVPIWAVLQEHLRAQKAETLAPLRKLAEEKSAESATALADPRDVEAVTGAFRRYPYSAAVHRAMLACGERMIREGRPGLAQRMLRDVLDRAAEQAVAGRARSGLWLAIAQEGSPDSGVRLAGESARARPDERLPWQGELLPAAEVLRRAAASVPAGHTASIGPLAGLRQTVLQLPDAPACAPGQLYGMPGEALASAWHIHGHAMPAGGGVLAAGPNLLAWYAPGQAAARWVRSGVIASDWVGRHERGLDADDDVIAPAAMRPVVSGGVIYCRWGLDRADTRPNALAAFDLATGRMLWSTAGDPFWQDLQPVGEPAVAEGRLYTLASRTEAGLNAPIYLACLRAGDGAGLWRRLLGHQTAGIRTERRGGFYNRRLSLMEYGAGVAVEGGEVYCSTEAGFIARCDARDGLVEWVRSYPAATSAQELTGLVCRQGGPPILGSERAIFAPRDCLGAFAVERATGKLLWDNAFLPSDAATRLADGRLLMRDGRLVAAVDAATGQPTWMHDVGDSLVGFPVAGGGSVLIATSAGPARLDLTTGTVIERAAWPGGRLFDAALVGNALAGISAASASAAPVQPAVGRLSELPPPAAVWSAAGRGTRARLVPPVRPGQPSDGSLRFAEGWRLARPAPRLFLSPEETHPAERIFLHSTGLLECLGLAPSPQTLWRTLVQPGFIDILHHEGLLVLVYRQELAAYGAADGKPRWRCWLPVPMERHQHLGRYLAAWPEEDDRRLVLADLTTGKVLWHRVFTEGLPEGVSPMARVAGWDGTSINVLAVSQVWGRGGRSYVRICRPEDGRIIRTVPLPSDPQSPERARATFAEGFLWYFGADGRLHELRLDGTQPPRTWVLAMPNGIQYDDWQPRRIDLAGPWICVRYGRQGRYDEKRTYFFRRDDLNYSFMVAGHGTVRGDLVYDLTTDTLRVMDLLARGESLRCRIPDVWEDNGAIVDFREDANSVVAVSFAQVGRYRGPTLRADRFDRKSGQHLGQQELGLAYWSDFGHDHYRGRRMAQLPPQVLWRGGGFLLTEPGSLRWFDVAGQDRPPAAAVHVVQPAPQPVRLDGDLAEWDAASAVPLAGATGAAGAILLSHDDANLYVAVISPDRDGRARIGAGNYVGGDFLTLGVQTNLVNLRLAVGQDDDARPRITKLLGHRMPEGVQAAVRHNPAAGLMIYELALPLNAIVTQSGDWRRMHLAAAAWDDRPPGGPAPAGRFGGGLEAAEPEPARYELIQLGPTARGHEEACLALARQAPQLAASREFLRQYGRLRVVRPDRPWQGFQELLAGHARNPETAYALLVVLDQTLRQRLTDDPRETVVAAATAAGVPEDIRRQYLAAASSYLSFWLRTEGATNSSMVLVQLFDGGGWEHRAFWGADRAERGTPGTPSRQRGGYYVGLEGQWQELRVPLIWLDMHDKPICGIGFNTLVVANIDRVAIVRDGKEEVILDEDFPPNSKSVGGFEWQEGIAHSGKRSLGKRGSLNRGRTHEVVLDKPVTLHLEGLPAAEAGLDKPRAAAALKQTIPALGNSEESWQLFQALLRLEAGADAARVAALQEWYLAANSQTTHATDLLMSLRQYYVDAKVPGWQQRIDALLRAHEVPADMEYTFRNWHMDRDVAFLRNWQVVGPFQARLEAEGKTHPIEGEPIDLAKSWPSGGDKGLIRWQLLASKEPLVDLDAFFGRPDFVFAYAICWAYAEKETPAMLEFAADDLGKVFLNRKKVLEHKGGPISPRAVRTKVALQAGWNEVLVKVADQADRWGFYLELLDERGRGLPPGVRLSTTPPKQP